MAPYTDDREKRPEPRSDADARPKEMRRRPGASIISPVNAPQLLEAVRAHEQGHARAQAAELAPLVRESIRLLGNTDTKDVQQIAASQLELLAAYHQVALAQSRRSFFWALIGSGLGLLLFVIAVAFSLWNGLSLASIVPLIAGAIVNVVSGIVFVLYGKTSSQLSAFHSRLEVLQRYLLANSICESLGEAERDKARASLIGEISHGQPAK